MANTIKHKTLPAGVDRPGFTGITPSLYGEEHAFSGGALGSVLVRNAGNSDGAAWIGTINGVLIASGTNVLPSFSATLPSAVQLNITQLGTITTGVWNAGSVKANNGSSYASIGGTGYGAISGNTKPGAAFADSTTIGSGYLSGYELSVGVGLGPLGGLSNSLIIQDLEYNGIINSTVAFTRTSAHGAGTPSYSLIPGAGNFINLGDPLSNAYHLNGVYTNDLYGYNGIHERFRTPAIGEWTAVTYNSSNFLASAGTWTVDLADQVRYSYMLIGKTMWLQFSLSGTSVSNAGASLHLLIPGGFVAAGNARTLISVIDNGGAIAAGLADAATGVAYISLYANAAGSGWAISTNATSMTGAICIEVQ